MRRSESTLGAVRKLLERSAVGCGAQSSDWNFLGGLLWISACWCWWLSDALTVVVWDGGGVVSAMEGLDWGSGCCGVRWSLGLFLDRGGAKVFAVGEMVCGVCGSDRGIR